jgi:hypothetical protein
VHAVSAKRDRVDPKSVWKAPTRRAFVAMLGLGTAALASVKLVGGRTKRIADSEPAPALPTRWIGHC